MRIPLEKMVMSPDGIDYKYVDPAMRGLIRKINSKKWIKTFGCCGGPASHRNNGGSSFYIILEVLGQNGVYQLARWLGRAHKFGFEGEYKTKTLPGFALFDATLHTPHVLSGEAGSGAVLGKTWFRFYVKFNYLYGPNRKQTIGSIISLENTI